MNIRRFDEYCISSKVPTEEAKVGSNRDCAYGFANLEAIYRAATKHIPRNQNTESWISGEACKTGGWLSESTWLSGSLDGLARKLTTQA